VNSENEGRFKHEILCLDKLSPSSTKLVKENKLNIFGNSSRHLIYEKLIEADIVHLSWWNHPLIYRFLDSGKMPSARVLVHSHVSGFSPPQVLIEEVVNYADYFIATTPHTLTHPVIKKTVWNSENKTISHIWSGLSRDIRIEKKEHKQFNVGYIGTVDYSKIHPMFVEMSSSVRIPNVRIIVCGEDTGGKLVQRAKELGVENKFLFNGFVPNITPVLEILDVFGYPLCPEHYGTGEQALIEAMAAGIPPVVFGYGTEKYLVENGVTGLIVKDAREYTDAIEHLFRNPKERQRIGQNAKDFVATQLSAVEAATSFHLVYEKMLKKKKRRRVLQQDKFEIVSGTDGTYFPGTRSFIRSLGTEAKDYRISTDPKTNNRKIVHEAEQRIAKSKGASASKTRGSVFHYDSIFPGEPYLSLWCGLVLQESGHYEEAKRKLLLARKLGIDKSRVEQHALLSNQNA
jgi:glycosyltransferase involved in cell wall biosynthesis